MSVYAAESSEFLLLVMWPRRVSVFFQACCALCAAFTSFDEVQIFFQQSKESDESTTQKLRTLPACGD